MNVCNDNPRQSTPKLIVTKWLIHGNRSTRLSYKRKSLLILKSHSWKFGQRKKFYCPTCTNTTFSSVWIRRCWRPQWCSDHCDLILLRSPTIDRHYVRSNLHSQNASRQFFFFFFIDHVVRTRISFFFFVLYPTIAFQLTLLIASIMKSALI